LQRALKKLTGSFVSIKNCKSVFAEHGNAFIVSIKEGASNMITVNLYYTGKNGSARAFAAEMESTGIANEIRNEPGNLRYQYFSPLNDPETVLLIDSWTDQAAIDSHHASPMMQKIMELREKYDLHMIAERFVSEEVGSDEIFIRK
jgi:quinol monooxygenase YgiN